MNNTIQSLVKLAELFEKEGLHEYAQKVEDLIKSIADDKLEILDNDEVDNNKE